MSSKNSAALTAILRLIEAAEKKDQEASITKRYDSVINRQIVSNARIGMEQLSSMLNLMPDPGEVSELMMAIYTHQRRSGDLSRATLRLKQVAMQVDAALDACVGDKLAVDLLSIEEARDVLLLSMEHLGSDNFKVIPGDMLGPLYAGAYMQGPINDDWIIEVTLTRGLPDDGMRSARWHLVTAARPSGNDDHIDGCEPLSREDELIWDSVMPKDAAGQIANRVRRLMGSVNGYAPVADVLHLVPKSRVRR